MKRVTKVDREMRLRPEDDRLRRMFKHVYASLRAAGLAAADAKRVAAATVNRHRAGRGATVAQVGRVAAARRGWWPGRVYGRRMAR